MSARAKRFRSAALVIGICLLVTAVGYYLQVISNNVRIYDAVFYSGIQIDRNRESVTLPFTEISLGRNNFLALEVPVTLDPNSNAIYIPHFQGRIELLKDGAEVFRTDPGELNTFNGRNELLIPLSLEDKQPTDYLIKLYFTNNVAKISPIYTGIDTIFQANLTDGQRQTILVSLSLGAYLLLTILLVASLLTGVISSEGVPLLFMTIYLAIIGSGNIQIIAEYTNYAQRYVLPLSPITLASVCEIFRITTSSDSFKLNAQLWVGAVTLSVFSYLIGLLLDLSIIDINTLISGPLLIILWPVVSIYILSITSQKLTFITVFTSVIIFYASFTTMHDGLSRLGVLNTTLFLANSSPLLFIAATAIIYFRLTGRARRRLTKVNQQISSQLQIQSEELEKENLKNIALVKERSALQQRDKLNHELHDGVLTYLAIINSMTEYPENEKEISVNKLSRNATQEIRIILESDPLSTGSLFQALASLRNQIMEPLKSLGIRIRWNLTRLHGLRIQKADVIMNIVRILQESIHNAVIRGKCSALTVVAFDTKEHGLVIAVLNSGGKTYSDSDIRGNGIKSIERRASRIGALFRLKSRPGGARALISLPNIDDSAL
ncbi:hypothetical protein N9L89_01085 [Gammaproteobacteria bacterium]|nr:hypothetical protein [Gammaproteobacteria bacterium]